MERFFYGGNNRRLIVAVEEANKLMIDRYFLSKIENIERFNMATEADGTGVTGKELIEVFKRFEKMRINVQTYRPCWRWSKALAFYDPAKGPKNIHLNSRKFNRSVPSLVGTLVHEVCHLYDNFALDFYLGHGDNSPVGKELTVPYLLGFLAKDCLS
jgi:hypothetical protein